MKNDIRSSTVRTQNFRQARILIIENDPAQLAMIEHCLRVCLPEVEPIKAIDEQQAITYLSAGKLDESKLPKLILLDMLMPHRDDSWRILRRIKELPAPANQIPVLMLSYSADVDDVSESYDQGSSSYLVKPANDDEWLAYFQMLCKYWWETVSLPLADYRY
ncbi:response regulator [uncultured Fibrella sp.]|uniref:response regulator n=1 Tax=uncultured Fibrella sp. TaxID=1284596 RepID=UPI0035C9E103